MSENSYRELIDESYVIRRAEGLIRNGPTGRDSATYAAALAIITLSKLSQHLGSIARSLQAMEPAGSER